MGTDALIAKKMKNGGYRYITCHWNGGVDYTGKILEQYYKDSDRVNKLIELGNISYLGKSLGPKQNWNNPNHDITLAYHRDRGDSWIHNGWRVVDGLRDLFGNESYTYIFQDGSWHGYTVNKNLVMGTDILIISEDEEAKNRSEYYNDYFEDDTFNIGDKVSLSDNTTGYIVNMNTRWVTIKYDKDYGYVKKGDTSKYDIKDIESHNNK